MNKSNLVNDFCGEDLVYDIYIYISSSSLIVIFPFIKVDKWEIPSLKPAIYGLNCLYQLSYVCKNVYTFYLNNFIFMSENNE